MMVDTLEERQLGRNKLHCVSKIPTFKLSVALSNLNRFLNFFALLESVWNLLQSPYLLPTLGMLLHYLWKLKKIADIQQIWKKMQTNFDKIFYVTVLLLIYFCNQFVAPEIRHSRRHCSVCQQTTWYWAMRTKILIKSLYLKRYTAKRLTNEFSEKIWTKHGVNKLLKMWMDTGTVDRAKKKRSHNNRLFSEPPTYQKKLAFVR